MFKKSFIWVIALILTVLFSVGVIAEEKEYDMAGSWTGLKVTSTSVTNIFIVIRDDGTGSYFNDGDPDLAAANAFVDMTWEVIGPALIINYDGKQDTFLINDSEERLSMINSDGVTVYKEKSADGKETESETDSASLEANIGNEAPITVGASDDDKDPNTTIQAAAENPYSIETKSGKLSFAGTRMLDVSIPSGDSAGKDYVLVIFNYENYTAAPRSPQQDFWPTVYQNGVELDTLRSRSVNDTEDYKILDGFYKTVIKGGVLEYGQAYEIKDDGPLTVVLKENGLSTVDPVSLEVNIGEEVSTAEQPTTEEIANEVTADTTNVEELTPNFVFHTDAPSSSEVVAKYETLTIGSSGDAVVKLQEALIEKQLLSGTADGQYGNMTAGAVSSFQESIGIAATGSADSITQEMLYEEYVEPEIDVAAVLQQGTWLFNGGDDYILNGISFTDSVATVAQVYFDGNGKHNNESNAFPYIINDNSLVLTMIDGSEMEVPYEVKNGQLCLNNGDWMSVADVKAGLQGNWTNKHSSFGVMHEYHTSIEGDMFYSEDANSNGYYFGPYEGSFELNFGGIDADFMHSGDWYYNVINGEVTLLRYDNIFTRTDVGLLGQYGYSF